MKFYDVWVEDHITHEKVVVASMCSRSEASTVCRTLEPFMACAIYIMETPFIYRRKDD